MKNIILYLVIGLLFFSCVSVPPEDEKNETPVITETGNEKETPVITETGNEKEKPVVVDFNLNLQGKDYSLPVSDVIKKTEKWVPFALSEEENYSFYYTGTLVRPITLRMKESSFPIKKGTELEFYHENKNILVLGFQLTEKIGVNVKESTLVLKVHSIVCKVDNVWKGSAPDDISFQPAEPVMVKSGNTTLNAPAGSQFTFNENGLKYIIVWEETEMIVDGEEMTLYIGMAAEFDENGNFVEMFVAK